MKKNILNYYAISFFTTFNFTTAIWTFFFTSYLNFSLSQAIFLVTLPWIISTLLEIPSWAWADRFWRKKLYILWTLMYVIELIIWIFSHNFYLFILSAVICWIWIAIQSGNIEAIIHDKLEEEWKENDFKSIWSNAYFYIFFWRAISASISWILYVFHPLIPILLTLISTLIILFLAINIEKPKQILSFHETNLSHFKETFWFLNKNTILIVFITIISLLSWIWNIYYFTQQEYFKNIEFSIEFIWIIFTIWAIISWIWSLIYSKISNILNEKQILNSIIFLVFFASILFVVWWKFLWFLAIILNSLMFWFIMPFWNNFLIQKSPKSQKSTILSIFNFSITIWYTSLNLILILALNFIDLITFYKICIFLIILLIIWNFLTFNKMIDIKNK